MKRYSVGAIHESPVPRPRAGALDAPFCQIAFPPPAERAGAEGRPAASVSSCCRKEYEGSKWSKSVEERGNLILPSGERYSSVRISKTDGVGQEVLL